MDKRARVFEAFGLVFKPIKTLPKAEAKFEVVSPFLNGNYVPEGWNYDEFYKIAKKNYCGTVDLFMVDGVVRIPATNYLFEYTGTI